MIPVVWLVNHPEAWDQGMVDWALSGRLWPTGYEFAHQVGFAGLDAPGAVVVVPAANQADRAEEINAELARLDWALVILTSDEERRFPLDALSHPNMAVWVQYPRQADRAGAYLPVGWPGHFPPLLTGTERRDNRWAFAGQVNHRRRKELVSVLRHLDDGVLVESPGFTQGLGHREYAALLAATEMVPCPSGPQSVDSFRVWESLEAGAVPVVDSQRPDPGGWLIDSSWLWGLVLGGQVPFPVIDDWASFPDLDPEVGERARLSAWWAGWKRSWCQRIGSTVHRLSGVAPETEPVTVLIPTSPIASHPDTAVIEETIASVRFWHPTAEIVVMCDGVRPEQEHYRARYEEYLSRLCWLAHRDQRILPVIHDEHLHQVEMTRRALDLVSSPLVLFVEHDTPLVTDEPIDWAPLVEAVRSGAADLVRFHFESGVHPEHEHLMLDDKPKDVRGAPLLRTVQWSQRPHLASAAFYRRLLRDEFPEGYVGMIEDHLHGVVHNAWREFGLAGWDRYRLWMYAPEGNIKRSLHLDGRGDDPKWPEG
jgi:hypothetical protein